MLAVYWGKEFIGYGWNTMHDESSGYLKTLNKPDS